jgi:hypothetical protein
MRAFAAILFLLLAGRTHAAGYVALGTPGYDVLLDNAPGRVEVYSYDTALDCGVPAVVTRNGRRIDIAVAALRPGGMACTGRYYVDVGRLASGWWTVAAHVASSAGEDIITDKFEVVTYGRSCNRTPRTGSIVNVFANGTTGTEIGRRIASDPALAAQLGNPQVSLTWYHDAGAQLVYPAPQDPLVWMDAAIATGLFTNVGLIRPLQSSDGPPAVVAPAIEFHHAGMDAYFYTTIAGEIAGLDRGTGGWARTGASFPVIVDTSFEYLNRLYEVYRFYGRPGGPTTHVFTLDLEECDAVQRSGVWQYEAVAFMAHQADDLGACQAATDQPVHRLWRPFGESRHRLTVDPAIVAAMTAQGWIDEGPVMCVPR